MRMRRKCRKMLKVGIGAGLFVFFSVLLVEWTFKKLDRVGGSAVDSTARLHRLMDLRAAAVNLDKVKDKESSNRNDQPPPPFQQNQHPPQRNDDERAAADKETIEQRFKRRRELLNRACKMYQNSSLFLHDTRGPNPNPNPNPNPKVNVKYEGIPVYAPVMNVSIRYCGIAKAASTTWVSFFSSLHKYMTSRGVKPSQDRKNTKKEISFVFVREPYARLWSAYVDKLLTPNEMFWRITGSYVAENFRQGAGAGKQLPVQNRNRKLQSQRPCGHDVTFPEFVRYVIDSQRTGAHRNAHFIPTHDHCGMCEASYEYIGHLETISEDMPYLVKAMESPISYNRTYETDTIVQNARMVLWGDRRTKVRRCMNLDEASRRLWKKYQIRGLINKREAFPYSPGSAVSITIDEFTRVALDAHQRSVRQDRERNQYMDKNQDRNQNPNQNQDEHHDQNRDQSSVHNRYQNAEVSSLKTQRAESLREAFSAVPIEDRLQLQQTLFLDFQMFGFDPYPEDVFPSQGYAGDGGFSYLDIN